jgi:hypothetical protein
MKVVTNQTDIFAWFVLSLIAGGCATYPTIQDKAPEPRTLPEASNADAGMTSETDAKGGTAPKPIAVLSTTIVSAFGDSLTYGFSPAGQVPEAARWPFLLSKGIGSRPATNYAINAATAATGWTDQLLASKDIQNQESIDLVAFGTNDARVHGESGLGLLGFRDALEANIAFLLARPAFTPASAPGIRYNGAWTPYAPLMNVSTNIIGDAVEFEASGSEVWIGTYNLCDGHNGSGTELEVRIDDIATAPVE